MYKKFFGLDKKNGHHSNAKLLKYKIGINPSRTIMRVQFMIRLIATCTTHPSQRLSFDCLVFDSIGVTKHGSTCTTLSKVHSK
jgi:hypothetical protein